MTVTHRATASRRGLLGAAAVGAGVAAPVALVGRADAATTYTPGHWKGPALLSLADSHLVRRFSYGLTPALAAQVRTAGGARKWFERQLSPTAVDPDPYRSWYTGLDLSPQQLWQNQVDETMGGWEVMANYARWCLVRRIASQHQVLELMTEFWENHFNVPVNGDAAFTWRTDYGTRIRALALTSFRQLLRTAVLHPAMGIYLNNAVSTRSKPNENLGRELLELHTVGRTAGYGEDDVKSSARILTGFRVRMWQDFSAWYDPNAHWVGPVTVLGQTWANDQADGREVTNDYLDFLARHPATAQRIARKLCVKFVRDNPPEALVQRLAAVYLANDTAIKPVLRALVASAEFQASAGAKLRDPGEDIVATYRLLRVSLTRPGTNENAAAHAILWQAQGLGSSPFSWPRPDGQPVDNEAWSSPARMMAAMQVHYTMSGRWWPTVGITYRAPTTWAGRLPIRFDTLVDKLSQEILHQRSTSSLLAACCAAVGVGPLTRITRDHAVIRWEFPRLLTTFLDSPNYYRR